jgi:hypothetical protein
MSQRKLVTTLWESSEDGEDEAVVAALNADEQVALALSLEDADDGGSDGSDVEVIDCNTSEEGGDGEDEGGEASEEGGDGEDEGGEAEEEEAEGGIIDLSAEDVGSPAQGGGGGGSARKRTPSSAAFRQLKIDWNVQLVTDGGGGGGGGGGPSSAAASAPSWGYHARATALAEDGFPDPLLPFFRPVAFLERLHAAGVEKLHVNYGAQFGGAAAQVARRRAAGGRLPATEAEARAAVGDAAGAGAQRSGGGSGAPFAVWEVTGTKGGEASAEGRSALARLRADLAKAAAGGGGCGKGRGKRKRGGGAKKGKEEADAAALEEGRAAVAAAAKDAGLAAWGPVAARANGGSGGGGGGGGAGRAAAAAGTAGKPAAAKAAPPPPPPPPPPAAALVRPIAPLPPPQSAPAAPRTFGLRGGFLVSPRQPPPAAAVAPKRRASPAPAPFFAGAAAAPAPPQRRYAPLVLQERERGLLVSAGQTIGEALAEQGEGGGLQWEHIGRARL